jgi:hypothetical protein
MKNHPLIAKKIEHLLPVTISMVPLFFQNFPITMSTPPPFHFQKSFSQKVGKSGEVPFKLFEEPSRRSPPHLPWVNLWFSLTLLAFMLVSIICY